MNRVFGRSWSNRAIVTALLLWICCLCSECFTRQRVSTRLGRIVKYSYLSQRSPIPFVQQGENNGEVEENCVVATPIQKKNETREEQLLRCLWEQEPFDSVHRLVSSIVAVNNSSFSRNNQPWLSRYSWDGEEETPMAPELSQLFDRLFEPNSGRSNAADSSVNDPFFDTHDRNGMQQKYQANFALEIAYKGDDFCGWQTQPNNYDRPSVQQTLEDWLEPFYQRSRRVTKRLESQSQQKRPPQARVNLRVSGRTDAGVHAVGQIARFRTWTNAGGESSFEPGTSDESLNMKGSGGDGSEKLLKYINQHPFAGTSFRCLSVRPVSSQFHPTFGATCRAYVYMIDAQTISTMLSDTNVSMRKFIERINIMLRALEGRELDYIAMSYGKVKTQTTMCTLHVARAFPATVNLPYSAEESSVVCIQLVGNRFLRRMVRILVATALREALLALGDTINTETAADDLIIALESKDRTQMARPAPPQGLVFVGAEVETP